MDAFNASLGLIVDQEAPLSVRLAAVGHTTRQFHFSEVPHSEVHRALEPLRSILGGTSPPPLKMAAIRSLAPSGDDLAKKEVLASLTATENSPLPRHEAIALLRFFPDQRARMRAFLSSSNDRDAIAAIHGLFKDPESTETRRSLTRNAGRSHDLRVAAIQSLMHEDTVDQTDFLVELAADPRVELDLRAEALASATVRLRKGVRLMTDEVKRGWAERLRRIQAADTTELGLLRRDALAIVSPNQ